MQIDRKQPQYQNKSYENFLNETSKNHEMIAKYQRQKQLREQRQNNQIDFQGTDLDQVESRQEAFLASQGAKYFSNSLQETELQKKTRMQNAGKLKQDGLKNMYKNLLIVQFFSEQLKQRIKKKQNKEVNVAEQQNQFSEVMKWAQEKAEKQIDNMKQTISEDFVKNAYRERMPKQSKIKQNQLDSSDQELPQKKKRRPVPGGGNFVEPTNLIQVNQQKISQKQNLQTYGYRRELITQGTISLQTLKTLAGKTSDSISSKWDDIIKSIKRQRQNFSFYSLIRWGGLMFHSLKNNVLRIQDWILYTGNYILNFKQINKQDQFTDDATFKFVFNVIWQCAIKGFFRKFKIGYNKQYKVIDYKIKSGAKIGIIGDYGTGLNDSIQLMRDMIKEKKVDIIIHVGDVYYAGGKDEYQRGILNPLNKIRDQLKNQREVLFYSIPGNHDYYSGGQTFLDFTAKINKHPSIKQPYSSKTQDASFFCLRDQQDKWQFLGMDTAYSQTQGLISQMIAQKNPAYNGPDIIPSELTQHKKRIDEFSGSTILLSHHQLFSIHDRISGQLTKVRDFSNINPKMITRMFSYSPFISSWFWGHQHSIMFFEDKILGLQRGRLLGNSSFHVRSDKYNPYSRHQGFPIIKIKQDWIHEQTKQKTSIIPNKSKSKSNFLDLSYAVIDMPNFDGDKQKYQQQELKIKYYCSPCFLNQTSQQQKGQKFGSYLLYSQQISPFTKIHKRKHIFSSQTKNEIFLFSQLGLFVNLDEQAKDPNDNMKINLSGVPIQVQFLEFIQDGQQKQKINPRVKVYIKAELNNEVYYLSCQNQKENRVNFVKKSDIKGQFQKWEIWYNFNEMKRSYADRKGVNEFKQKKDIKLYDSFWLYNVGKNGFLQLDAKEKESNTFVLRTKTYTEHVLKQVQKREEFMKENTFIFMLIDLSPEQRIMIPKENK